MKALERERRKRAVYYPVLGYFGHLGELRREVGRPADGALHHILQAASNK